MKKKSKGKYLQQTSRKSKIPLILVSVIALLGLLATGIFFITRLNNNNVTISNAEEAISHAKKLGEEYGYENAMDELTEKNTASIDGDNYYRLQQNYHGIPVYGKTIVYSTDSKGNILTVTGNVDDISGITTVSPSVTEKQIEEKMKTHFASQPQIYENLNPSNIVLSDNLLCIYYSNTENTYSLAYRLVVGGYEIILNAHTGDVLFSNSLTRFSTTSSSLKGQQKSYTLTHYTNSGMNFLIDSERGIEVYTAHNDFDWSILEYVYSDKDLVKWSGLQSPEKAAVDAYANVQITYDFFNTLGNRSLDGNGNAKLSIITDYHIELKDDGEYDVWTDNAFFRYIDEDNYGIYFTIAENEKYVKSTHLDWVAHEYMHGVEQFHSSMFYSGESGAIMEALSDIFGELVESWYKKESPNWSFSETQRLMSAPRTVGFPQEYHDENWVSITDISEQNDFGGVHKNNTVISHAAYLMWYGIDGSSNKQIPTSDLAKLWYRAMLMMPSDCNFIECRRFVEYAAQSMEELSDQQRKCVSEAFDKVGIVSDNPVETQIDYRLSDNGVLSVFDKNGDLYSGYTLNIQGIQNELFVSENTDGTLNFYNGGSWYESVQNISETPLTLDLPYGCYTFTITDSYNPDYTYSFTVSVGYNGTENSIDLFTAFEKPLVVTITDPTTPEDTNAQITPGFYAHIDNELNRLTIHEATSNNITFTAWWYRIWDIYKANATLSGNIASFNYTASNNDALHASGTINFQENTAILTLTECTQTYVDTGEYRYKLIGVLFSEDQLNTISSALGVPEDLEVQITQGEPAYWEGGGFYRTPIEIYYNGELVAGASVNSLTGELAGSIYMYTAPTSTSNSVFNLESTFGFEKAWDIHDRSTTEHFVTSLAFNEDSTFSCGVGWYLSEWYVAFTGTYEVSGDEVILHYILDGQEKTTSYQVKWDDQTLRQTSEENLVIAHQIGSEYPFEENSWYSADDLVNQVETFIRYS